MNSTENFQFSSERLLAEFSAGQEQAAFEIYERYSRRVLGLANRQISTQARFDANDVAQETFQVFFEMAQSGKIRWERPGDLWRLIAGITVKRVLRQFDFHNAAKRSTTLEQVVLDQQTDPLDQHLLVELQDVIENVLSSEKPLARRVLQKKLQGFDNSEIADSIGRTPRTVRRMLESIKSKLQDHLQISGYQPADAQPQTDLLSRQFRKFHNNELLLLRLIGEGGFSKVYLARMQDSTELVAVKVTIKKWQDHPKVQMMFRTELQSLAQLDHPHIVKIRGWGKLPPGNPFLVMDYVNGRHPNTQDATNQMVNQWIEQLRSALQYAHRSGWTHGDLRIENLLIDNSDNLRLIDFGFSTKHIGDDFDQKTNHDWQQFDSLSKQLRNPSNDT